MAPIKNIMSGIFREHALPTKATEHETKYVFNNINTYAMIRFLENACQKDGSYPEGMVSSIYYDTKDWTYMSEKINSDYLKTKIRVRWYSDMNNADASDYSFAEMKYKVGCQRRKVRIKTEVSGTWLNTVPMENAELRRLPNVLRDKGMRIRENLHPIFQISYRRHRFVDPYSGARICIDYDISAPRVNGYMLPKRNPFMLSTSVFELKGSVQDLPNSLKPLILLGCRKASFSKYQACYQKVMNVVF